MKREPVWDPAWDEQIDRALALAEEWYPYWPAAVRARYIKPDDLFRIELATGVQVDLPRRLLQGLERATPQQLARVRITNLGEGLRWASLDLDHYIPALLNGVYGARKWMEHIGLAEKRPRKSGTARKTAISGRKSSRPRKKSA